MEGQTEGHGSGIEALAKPLSVRLHESQKDAISTARILRQKLMGELNDRIKGIEAQIEETPDESLKRVLERQKTNLSGLVPVIVVNTKEPDSLPINSLSMVPVMMVDSQTKVTVGGKTNSLNHLIDNNTGQIDNLPPSAVLSRIDATKTVATLYQKISNDPRQQIPLTIADSIMRKVVNNLGAAKIS